MKKKLLLKYSKRECTPQETAEVKQFIQSSADAQKLVDQYKVLLEIGDDISLMESMDYQQPLAKIKAMARQEKRRILVHSMTKVAAVLMFPLLLSSLLLSYILFIEPKETEIEHVYTEVVANPGTIIKHTLPDNSTVYLNSGTRLKYDPNNTEDRRTIELIDGEIYLEVEADKKRPFYVNTPDGLSVYVYGTRFNIRNFKSDSIIETVLETGALNVLIQNDESEYVLQPGQGAFYNKKTHGVVQEDVELWEKIAWHEGKLVFRNASLENILDRLSVHFAVEIEYINHKGIDYKYRATFSNESLQQILTYLSKSATIKWEAIEGDGNNYEEKIRVDIY